MAADGPRDDGAAERADGHRSSENPLRPRGVTLPPWVPRAAIPAGIAVLTSIILVDFAFILRPRTRAAAPSSAAPPSWRDAPSSSSAEPEAAGPSAADPPSVAILVARLKPVIDANLVAPSRPEAAGLSPELAGEDADDPPSEHGPERHERYRTVQQASERSCSTSSVDGLSRQIIAEARCIDANAFVPVLQRPNLVTASHVFLYLEAEARNRLVRVLDEHPDRTMTVNSALRTVAQQYLLSQWSRRRRCGIQLATPPGESNHETGLALDIAEPGTWRAALEAQEFHWLGSIDRVHFDYAGSGATSHTAIDVMAFQQLWNRNHPDDTIPASGRYTPPTEVRLKQAPAGGFATGAACHRSASGGGGPQQPRAR